MIIYVLYIYIYIIYTCSESTLYIFCFKQQSILNNYVNFYSMEIQIMIIGLLVHFIKRIKSFTHYYLHAEILFVVNQNYTI